MEFEEAKIILKNGYVDAGLELTDENSQELFFKRSKRFEDKTVICVSQEEIKEYVDFEELRLGLKSEPVECSICSPNYREHMVYFTSVANRGQLFRDRPSFSKDKAILFGEKSEEKIYAEVGHSSIFFVNFFRFHEKYRKIFIETLRFSVRSYQVQNVPLKMRDLLHRPLTIRVYNLAAASSEEAVKRSNQVIDSCLFELSYLKGITLSLQEEWTPRQQKVRPFQLGENYTNSEQLPLPKATFNSDIIRFYQRGMSTDDPVIQFLSFYQVLEYYFVSVSDKLLYDKLSRRINDPKFSTSQSNLDRIIQDTSNHKSQTNETDMLKQVLDKFIDETELIEFIKAYEIYLKNSLYSKKCNIFGEDIEVKLLLGHVFGNLAKRIKTIRNALVHSSDRYERNQRYIPTTSNENIIRSEIPLIKYLSEKVIIASKQ